FRRTDVAATCRTASSPERGVIGPGRKGCPLPPGRGPVLSQGCCRCFCLFLFFLTAPGACKYNRSRYLFIEPAKSAVRPVTFCAAGQDLLQEATAMTTPGEPDTEQLLERVAAGDPAARELLLDRHRRRLRRMIGLRLDRRLWARVDPSDVLQETLAEGPT